MPTKAIVNAGAALVCVLLLGYGYVLEYAWGLEPCPLCILQRLAFAVLALVFLFAAAHRPRSRGGSCVYGAASGLVAATGAAIAGWHVWLQSLPPGEAPECGPGLAYIMGSFPFFEAVAMIFSGSGECAEVSWSFLFLSIPAWALVWFVALGAVGMLNNCRTPQGTPRARLFR